MSRIRILLATDNLVLLCRFLSRPRSLMTLKKRPKLLSVGQFVVGGSTACVLDGEIALYPAILQMSHALPCQTVRFDMRSKAIKYSANCLVDGSTKSLLTGEYGLHPRDPLPLCPLFNMTLIRDCGLHAQPIRYPISISSNCDNFRISLASTQIPTAEGKGWLYVPLSTIRRCLRAAILPLYIA